MPAVKVSLQAMMLQMAAAKQELDKARADSKRMVEDASGSAWSWVSELPPAAVELSTWIGVVEQLADRLERT